ncbi:choice-of-anchor A family protein [Hyalangium sp.]|uniref:choice-of-anchor A family protein n=1 Tax=Hyalangium sp. TaxID=2028555 RepID=UPI002D3CE3EE|nr:choice-of-anchor A family protein [Hyalangium sp.]HYI02678.1 choice-of-anchor A family protein [Hyalangium sp.]
MKRQVISLLAALAFITTACSSPEGEGTAEKSEKTGPLLISSVLNDAKARASLKSARSQLVAPGTEAIVWDDECFALSLPPNDDSSTSAVALPFELNFFGTTYSNFFINNNGNVTFDAPMRTWTPFQLTANTPPIIAAFLADVDTRTSGGGNPVSGLTTYSENPISYEGHRAFCISWVDVGYFSQHTDKLNTFQLLLVERADTGPGDFDIVLNYSRILWETGDASQGHGGFGGTPAGAGFSAGNGDPAAFFQFPGSLVTQGLLDSNPETGLVHNSRNSPLLGRYVFNVRNGHPDVTPPVSTAFALPPPDASGEYHGPVSVTITATDDESGVASITYALSGATAGGATVTGSAASLPPITNLGVTTITYYARDVAGNVEAPRTLVINITPEPVDCVTVRLHDYNLFLLGDYTGGHDVVGKVAAGGNISMHGFAVGSGLAETDIDNVLVAGGNLDISHGGVFGNAFYGGSTTADGTVTFARGQLAQGSPIDFTARGTELGNLSTFLAGQAATGTTTREVWGGIFSHGTHAGLNVFDVNASDFNGAVLWSIDAPAGSFVVVNIRGASASFGGFGIHFTGGIDQHGVLYNFVDATSITANGFGFWGTVLAPSANITFNNGSWDGGIYAHSLTGDAEGHINPLNEHEICTELN